MDYAIRKIWKPEDDPLFRFIDCKGCVLRCFVCFANQHFVQLQEIPVTVPVVPGHTGLGKFPFPGNGVCQLKIFN
jgi:hypothetical protein